MIKKLFAFTLLFLITINAFSQEISEKKWKFAFQVDNRFSSIRKTEIAIFGAKAGIQYKNLTRFGIGVSFVVNSISIEYFNKKLKVQETNNFNFWYFSVFNDWILYKSDHWECFVTEQIGTGNPSFIKEINNEIVSDVNVRLYVNEISGQVNYKINDWIGAGTGVGYRNLWNKSGQLKDIFNAPIYIVKILIYPEGFFKSKNLN